MFSPLSPLDPPPLIAITAKEPEEDRLKRKLELALRDIDYLHALNQKLASEVESLREQIMKGQK